MLGADGGTAGEGRLNLRDHGELRRAPAWSIAASAWLFSL
jgi:hypothetical protein